MDHRSSCAVRVAILLALAAPAARARAQDQHAAPALVVLVSVDQLATWVLDAALPALERADGGFRRLIEGGTSFPNCAYRHGCTTTGPGHATLGTGATAAVHGIVGNHWLDAATGARQYCASSPPTDGGAAVTGAGRLLVPTFGDALKEQLPKARALGLSLKDRSAVLMAGAGADLALWLDQQQGRFVTSAAYASVEPAWLTRFHGASPFDRHFGRRWQRVGEPADYAGLTDERPFEGRDPNGRRSLPQRLDGGLQRPGPAFYSQLYTSPVGHEVLVALARAAIDAYQLGRDATPDLLCLSFSSTDAIGHRFGPTSVEARDALLQLDRQLAELLRTLDARVGRDRYTLLLSADHGVAPEPELRSAAGLSGGRAGRQSILVQAAIERALRDAYGAAPDGARSWLRGRSGGWLYLDHRALAARGIDVADAAATAANAVVGIEGVRIAIPTVGEVEPPPELAAILRDSVQPQRTGDLWLVLEPYWLGSPQPTGSHGSPWDYDRDVPLLAYGCGIRPGLSLDLPVTPGTAVVIAAALCGIEPPAGATDPLPRAALLAPPADAAH